MNQKPLRWEEDGLVKMGQSDDDSFNVNNICIFYDQITIPSVFIHYEDGLEIQRLLYANDSLFVEINKTGESNE